MSISSSVRPHHARLRTPRLSQTIIVALLLLVASQIWASDKKEWVTLNDCQYVDWKDNDGDSFRVRCGDKEFTARLYFVDTPETNLKYAERTREQSLHFEITLDETMKAGVQAKERVHALLQKPFVVHTVWASAAGRGREARYNVLIEVDGKSLAEILVAEGLARAKGVPHALPNGEKSRDYMDRLAAMEGEARQKRLGAWSSGTLEEKKESVAPAKN
jgi:endonuclease YncB( thermonuclease family)